MSRQDGVDALGETLGGAEALASAPVVVSAKRLSRGAIIDRYVVIEFLGAGGMGQVFAAYDPELDRRVAIKLLREDLPADRETLDQA